MAEVTGVLEQPMDIAFGRVRGSALTLGWRLVEGGPPAPIEAPLSFSRYLGILVPAARLVVRLSPVGPDRTQVGAVVTHSGVASPPGVIDGDAAALLTAIGAHPA